MKQTLLRVFCASSSGDSNQEPIQKILPNFISSHMKFEMLLAAIIPKKIIIGLH